MKEFFRIMVIITIFLMFHLPFYTSYPPYDMGGDESWYMDYSIEFLKTGSLKGSIFPFTPLNEPSPLNPHLFNGLISLIFLINSTGIDSARIISLISGLGIVLLTYIAGRRILSVETGIISAIYIGTSIFFMSSHQVRPEALFTLMLLCGYYLFYRYLAGGSYLYLFLSGFIISLLIEVHLNAVIAIMSLFIMYLIFYRFYNRRFKDIIYLIMGNFTSFIIWVSLNYKTLRKGFESFKTVHMEYMPVILSGDMREYLSTVLRSLWVDFDTLFRDIYLNNFPLEIYFFTGLSLFLLYIIFSREEMKKTLLIIVTIISIWLSSIIVSLRICQPVYVIYFMPFMALIYGFLIYILYKTRFRIHVIIVALITLLMNIYDTLDTGMRLREARKEYINALTMLRDSLPPDKKVLGSNNYYQALYEKVNFSGYLFIQNSCPDFGMSVRALSVDYIILDDMLRTLSIKWCGVRYYDKIISFLERDARLIKSITLEYPNFNGTHGLLREIHIFRVLNIP